MVLSAYAQKSTSIKAFEYPDYLCPNPYTGKPIYGGNTLEISYSEKKNSYGIDFRYGYIRYMINLTYKGMDNGRYIYTGFEIETIPGVTAFCAIGSHLGYPIVEKEEVLAIVPATAPKEKIDAVLAVADDAVIMKVYKNFDEVQETLIKHNMADDGVMISRVGLPDEQVFVGLDNIPKDTKLNYLSTILAKRKDR